jgi:AhpD family alkylhydroperoxidase
VRLPAAGEAPPSARAFYGADGSASALTRSFANAPDVMEALMPFLGQILDEGGVDLATKELVIMRVSALNRCSYCLAAHRGPALEAGVPETHLVAVCGDGDVGQLGPRERAIVQWVDRVTLGAADIDDDLVAATLGHVRDDQLIELTLLAGAVGMLNRYCTALAIPAPGGAPP